MFRYLIVLIFFNLSCIHKIPTAYEHQHKQKFENFIFLKSIIEINEEISIEEANASGVLYKEEEGLIYILTAAHFCDPQSFELKQLLQSPAGKRKIIIYNEKTERLGMIFKVDIEQDLCMIVALKQEKESFKSLRFAKNMPKIGEKIYNTGAPDGISSPSIKILLDGYFSGCNFGHAKYCLYTIPATFGSSGSAVYNKNGEIISIIVAADPGFENISMGPDIYNIKKFIGQL